MEPLNNAVRRNIHDILSEFQLDRNGKNTAKILKEWKEKFSMRPIWNCTWSRKCVPTNPYDLITTDILHEFIHGILDYLITNMSELFKRNKLNKQVIDMMGRIIEEFKFFSSPSFTIKNNIVVVDPTNVIRLRALDIALDRSEIKIKSSDSVFAWLHACFIVIGYGDDCPLSYEGGNELHHYRMIMNLVRSILIELETTSIHIDNEWINKVDTMVEGIILLLQDPHMYMKHGTEKMHRLRHVTDNFRMHGSFKNSNTSHWERGHTFFTKQVFENVGRHGREHCDLPPKAKMLLEVYSIFISTYFMKEGAKYREDPVEDELAVKVVGVDIEDKVALDNDDEVAVIIENKVALDNEYNYLEAGIARTENAMEMVDDMVKKWYRLAYASWKKGVEETKNKKNREKLKRKAESTTGPAPLRQPENDPPEFTLPPELNDAFFYRTVQKSFAMTTAVPIPSVAICLDDGRRSQKFSIGSCVVLETAPEDVPSFAIIDGIVKTETKIYLLLEYIYSSKTMNTVSDFNPANYILTYFT